MLAIVTAVSRSSVHNFSKLNVPAIRLVAGLGVEGDAHLGEKVQHLYHARKNPHAPNLRQVHLMHEELFDELRAAGFDVSPGAIGENVTTRGLDLLALPTGARLRLGGQAVIEITGLRNPCRQINAFQEGLTAAVLGRDAEGRLIRKGGVMAIIHSGGVVKAGDSVAVELPQGEKRWSHQLAGHESKVEARFAVVARSRSGTKPEMLGPRISCLQWLEADIR